MAEPQDDTKPILKKQSEHAIPQLGRKRRASGSSRLFGYMMLRDGNPQPLLIVSVLTLERNPGIDLLRRTLSERLLELPRFRSRIVVGKGPLHFVECEVDIGYHFEVFGFGRKVSVDELEDFIARSKARPLDTTRPLWRVTHIPEMEDGTSKIVVLINHAIGDGISLVNALLFKIIDEASSLAEKYDTSQQVRRRSQKPNLPALTRIRVAVSGFFEGHTGAFWRQDRKNPLKLIGVPGKEKVVASSPKLDLNRVKQVCKTIGKGVTINDVLMATFTKMVGMYFRDVSKEDLATIKQRKVRVNFPVNVRKSQAKASEFEDTGNQLALALFHLPMVDFDGTGDLVLAIKARVDELKCSPAIQIAAGTPGRLIPVLPRNAIVDIAFNAVNIATCMISNVPGPQEQCHIAGQKLDNMEFFLFGSVGVYFGLFSYNGMVSATANMDTKVGADPHAFVNLFLPAFEEIYQGVCGDSKLADNTPEVSVPPAVVAVDAVESK